MRTWQRYPLETVESGGVAYRAYRMPFRNLYDTLADSAERYPEKTAIIDARRQVTFRELRQETDAFAAWLSARADVGRGSRVGLMMVNSIEFAVAFYAVMKLGATIVSVNTKYSADEAGFVLTDSEATCLLLDERWLGRMTPALGATKVAHVICSGAEGQDGPGTMAAAIREGAGMPQAPAEQEDSLLGVIMYTSGTTGRPKGAMMTQFNLLQGMYSYAVLNDMDDTESTVLSVPAFHITGLNCVMTLFIFLGGLMVMTPFFDATDVLDKMTEYRVSHIHAVATIFIMLESAMQPRHDLSALHTALCGGGFISRETIARFCRQAPNCRFHPVYGMTETSGAGTYFPVHCLDSDIENSCGRTAPNGAIRVVDTEERELPPGETGEICFTGSFTIRGYLHGKGDENIRDGWLHSGDIGCFDGDGYLFIKDRIKDMINRGGEKIYSLAVEDAIMRFGGIKQAVVFAVRDSLYGEVPGAVVVPEPGEQISLEALRLYLREHLAHYKVPVYMEIRETLPVTANGKARKFILKEEFNRTYAK